MLQAFEVKYMYMCFDSYLCKWSRHKGPLGFHVYGIMSLVVISSSTWVRQNSSKSGPFFLLIVFFSLQAKEAWEMEGAEKLEQSEILKTKGTNNYKVNFPH